MQRKTNGISSCKYKMIKLNFFKTQRKRLGTKSFKKNSCREEKNQVMKWKEDEKIASRSAFFIGRVKMQSHMCIRLHQKKGFSTWVLANYIKPPLDFVWSPLLTAHHILVWNSIHFNVFFHVNRFNSIWSHYSPPKHNTTWQYPLVCWISNI